MADTPARHPLRDTHREARRRGIAAHPAGRARRPVVARASQVAAPAPPSECGEPDRDHHEAGSMTTEYGLIVVVGATICSLVIKWASGGAVFELLGGVLEAAKGLVGF